MEIGVPEVGISSEEGDQKMRIGFARIAKTKKLGPKIERNATVSAVHIQERKSRIAGTDVYLMREVAAAGENL